MTPGRAPDEDRRRRSSWPARGRATSRFARLVDAHAGRVLAFAAPARARRARRRGGRPGGLRPRVAQPGGLRGAGAPVDLASTGSRSTRRAGALDATARVVDAGRSTRSSPTPRPPHERVESAALAELLDRELARLPGPLRAAVVLRASGLRTAEAAGACDVGEAASKSRLHRGRTRCATLEPQMRDWHDVSRSATRRRSNRVCSTMTTSCGPCATARGGLHGLVRSSRRPM